MDLNLTQFKHLNLANIDTVINVLKKNETTNLSISLSSEIGIKQQSLQEITTQIKNFKHAINDKNSNTNEKFDDLIRKRNELLLEIHFIHNQIQNMSKKENSKQLMQSILKSVAENQKNKINCQEMIQNSIIENQKQQKKNFQETNQKTQEQKHVLYAKLHKIVLKLQEYEQINISNTHSEHQSQSENNNTLQTSLILRNILNVCKTGINGEMQLQMSDKLLQYLKNLLPEEIRLKMNENYSDDKHGWNVKSLRLLLKQIRRNRLKHSFEMLDIFDQLMIERVPYMLVDIPQCIQVLKNIRTELKIYISTAESSINLNGKMQP